MPTVRPMQLTRRKGGYIWSPTHSIRVDRPPANIVAMYVEAGSVEAVEGEIGD